MGGISSRLIKKLRLVNESSITHYQKLINQFRQEYFLLTHDPLDPYVRPAFGVFSEQSLAVHQKLGLYTVFWSLSHTDWNSLQPSTAEKGLKTLSEQVTDGSIITLNPNSPTNIEILPALIEYAQQSGYQFKRLDYEKL